MNEQTFYSSFLLSASVATFLIACQRWRRRHVRPIAGTGAILLLACAEWILTTGLEIAVTDPEMKRFWYNLERSGQLVIPTAWLVMAWQFTGRKKYITRRSLSVLSVFPVLYVLLIFTNNHHRLVFSAWRTDRIGSIQVIRPDYGAVTWFAYLYAYILIGIGSMLLLQMLVHSRRLHLWQGITILITVTLTLSANLLELTGTNLFPMFQLTPVVLSLAVPLAAMALGHLERVEIIPVARGKVFQTIEDAVIVLDPRQRILDLNPAAETLIGHSLPRVVGQAIGQVWPEGLDQIASSSANGRSNWEINLGHGPTQRTYDVRQSALLDWRGHLVSQIIVLRDITARARAEEALRASEERYRLHFDHVNDVIWTLDTQFRITAVSPSIEQHLGFKPEEVIGKSFPELNILSPEYLEAALDNTLRVFAGESIASTVYEFITRSGARKIGEVSGAPVLVGGQVMGIISVARDITERQQAEEQLKASLHEKEVLLKEIHHRVKNNLQIISSLLSLQVSSTEDSRTADLFRESQDRIRAMALIHEQLYQTHNLASINFGDYIDNLLMYLRDSYGATARQVQVISDAPGVDLNLDIAIPCGLIINELVSNAFKYAYPDGRGGQVRVSMRADGDGRYIIAVTDDGIGLPPGLEIGSTGSLGLRLIKALTQQIRGTLDVCSDHGAAFKIAFMVPQPEGTRHGASQDRDR